MGLPDPRARRLRAPLRRAALGERAPGSAFVYADDIDAVYELWQGRAGAAARFTPLGHTNYGMRAFTMFDPDGNEIRVGWPPR